MIFPILALDDNYIWLWQESDTLVIVDPSESTAIVDWLMTHGVRPTAIFITHAHHDHIGGVNDLIHHYPELTIYAHESTTNIATTHPIKVGDSICIGNFTVEVMDLSGHTPDHLGYYIPNQQTLFCGDALFAGGCGRLFNGGTATQMTASLARIANLPLKTQLYPAHEYTLANLRFAKMVEPNNSQLLDRLTKIQKLSQQLQVTLPTQVDIELETNPFLRTHLAQVENAIANWSTTYQNNPVEKFAQLRAWKDSIDRTGILELPA